METKEKRSGEKEETELVGEKKAKKRVRVWLIVLIAVLALLAALAAAYFVLYGAVYPRIVSELGSPVPGAIAFLKDEGHTAEYLSSVDGIDTSREGSYILDILVDGAERKVILAVRDTTPPTAEAVESLITIDEERSPQELVSGIADKTLVTVSYKTAPEFGKAGDYDAVIKLADEGGNVTLITVPVHIRAVKDTLTYEAGEEKPGVEDFTLVEREDAFFVTDMEALAWDVPGKYDVAVNVDGSEYVSVLEITDTVPPELAVKSLIVAPGAKLAMDECVVSAKDATALELTFDGEVDTDTQGEYAVTVTATDLGGNSVSDTVSIVVSDYVLELEARNEQVNVFEIAEATDVMWGGVAITEPFIPRHVGAHAMFVGLNGTESCVAVRVSDTVAPAASPVTVTGCTGYPHEAGEFVTDIVDMTDVTASFATEPDWTKNGTQTVSVVITDEAGNSATVVSSAEIAPDTEAPALYGVKNRYCYVDEAVAYFKEVFAEDNADADVELTVDKSKVDIHKVGEYEVTYTARDRDGNTASASAVYTFIEQKITDEELDKLADEVLSEILTDDMTLTEQARAIFLYVYNHVMYINGSDKTDWKSEAYRGITQGSGDCFTCYSTEYLLLSKIDCEIMSVERLGGATRHYWCLVNLGYGWYHFDACNAGPENYMAFMSTNNELWFLGPGYWYFDQSLYPEIETVPYFMNPDNPDYN